jgi:glutamyl-tRNA reductase
MSPISQALHQRFDEVCRTELQRLRRKTASLSATDRAEVDAITRELTQAMAARVSAVLNEDPRSDLGAIVARLFAVPVAADDSAAGGLGR